MIKNFLKQIVRRFKTDKKSFPGSQVYWEQRYTSNDNSGSGSYGRLSAFKAKILNHFVAENEVQSVIELGCGDGNQLSLATYPSYIGVDVSKRALDLCITAFSRDKTKSFYLYDQRLLGTVKAELAMSLDVIYHLIEDKVFEDYLKALFEVSEKYVIIYSSNYDAKQAPHVRCRKFTDWIESNLSNKWRLVNRIPNEFPFDEKNPDQTSMSDFYFYERIEMLN